MELGCHGAPHGYHGVMPSDVQITVDVPAPLAGTPAAELAARARLLLVIDEVRAGRLTRGGAARALGVPLDDFLIVAGQHGLYAIDYDLDDLRRELDAIPRPGGSRHARRRRQLAAHLPVPHRRARRPGHGRAGEE
jgi:predicted HTH domain antitoxin